MMSNDLLAEQKLLPKALWMMLEAGEISNSEMPILTPCYGDLVCHSKLDTSKDYWMNA